MILYLNIKPVKINVWSSKQVFEDGFKQIPKKQQSKLSKKEVIRYQEIEQTNVIKKGLFRQFNSYNINQTFIIEPRENQISMCQ